MTYLTVTLSSDAAYNTRYQIAAWACWLESTDGSIVIKRSGRMRTDPGGSVQAELMAISNALALLQKQVDLSTVKLTIKTDSLTSIEKVQSLKKRAGNSSTMPMLNYIKAALAECKTWGMVHIPSHKFESGHKEYGAKHYERNHWCDRQAATRQYEHIKEIQDAKSHKKRNRNTRHKTEARKQRQKTVARRMVRAGLTAYKRPKGNISE